MSRFQEVLSAARALNTSEQILLASPLWDDIPPADRTLPDAEWIAESPRRSDGFDRGRDADGTVD
jgi:hypothetical protein